MQMASFPSTSPRQRVPRPGPRASAAALALAVALLAAAAPTAGPAAAQDPPTDRAGLVVAFSDGSVRALCLDLDRPDMTGLDLLQRSGLDLRLEVSAAGTTVCRIEGDGCPEPEPCWCQCTTVDGPCAYWAYHLLPSGAGAWSQAQVGPADRTLSPGDVDGWAWGAGTAQAGPQPPLRTFAEVCAPAADVPPAEAPAAAIPTTGIVALALVAFGLAGLWLWSRRGSA